MKRLDTKTLFPFLESAGVAVVFIASAERQATMQLAEEFAQLWADTVMQNLVGLHFGYIDGSACLQARAALGAGELPAILLIRNGAVTHRFGNGSSRRDVMAALKSRDSRRRHAWQAPAPWQTAVTLGGPGFEGVSTREAA